MSWMYIWECPFTVFHFELYNSFHLQKRASNFIDIVTLLNLCCWFMLQNSIDFFFFFCYIEHKHNLTNIAPIICLLFMQSVS